MRGAGFCWGPAHARPRLSEQFSACGDVFESAAKNLLLTPRKLKGTWCCVRYDIRIDNDTNNKNNKKNNNNKEQQEQQSTTNNDKQQQTETNNNQKQQTIANNRHRSKCGAHSSRRTHLSRPRVRLRPQLPRRALRRGPVPPEHLSENQLHHNTTTASTTTSSASASHLRRPQAQAPHRFPLLRQRAQRQAPRLPQHPRHPLRRLRQTSSPAPPRRRYATRPNDT